MSTPPTYSPASQLHSMSLCETCLGDHQHSGDLGPCRQQANEWQTMLAVKMLQPVKVNCDWVLAGQWGLLLQLLEAKLAQLFKPSQSWCASGTWSRDPP